MIKEFRSGGLRIASVLEPWHAADRLTVVMNGYCNRVTEQPPVFVSWPHASKTFGHILRISDPTLFLSDWQQHSFFIGTETDNPVLPVVDYSRQVAQELGLPRNRIGFFGHSAGAFGALQCAIHDGVAVGLAINPILEIEPFGKLKIANEIAKIFRPNAELLELCKSYPERFSLTAAVRRAHDMGAKPRLGIIQNIADRICYTQHFRPFCKAMGISRLSRVDRTTCLHAKTYWNLGGHLAIPEVDMMGGLLERLLARSV